MSFDGVPPAQALRGEGTFQLQDRILQRLLQRQPGYFRRQVHVAMTVLPETVAYLTASVAYFLRRGVRRIHLSPVFTPSGGWGGSRRQELRDQFESLFALCYRDWQQTGEVPVRLFHRWDLPPSGTTRRPDSMCGVLSGQNPALDVDGELHACPVFVSSGASLPEPWRDRLRAGMRWGKPGTEECEVNRLASAARLKDLMLFTDKARKHSPCGACGDCDHLNDCRVCPYAIVSQAGNEDPHLVPAFLCDFNGLAAEFRCRFPPQPLPAHVASHPALLDSQLAAWRRRVRHKVRHKVRREHAG